MAKAPLGGSWLVLGVTLLYAAGVSVFVAMSMESMMGAPSTKSSASGLASGSVLIIVGSSFLLILGSAVSFVVLVWLLDLLTQRKQQLVAAFSVGLAAAATYYAVLQIAAVQSYAHYKSWSAAQEPTAPAAPTNR